MRHLWRLILAWGVVALLGAAFSAPASAAGGRMLFVQGRPDVTVDICVGGTEIASNLAYGQHKAKLLSVGTKTILFAKAAPGACTGTKLASRKHEVAPDSDRTVVLTRFAPKMVVYPQTPGGVPGPTVGTFVLRHAADIGRAGFRYTSDGSIPWYPQPTVDAPFKKGDWGIGTFATGVRMFWWVHRPPAQRVIADVVELVVEASTRHELVLMGTTLGNVKLVRIDTPS